MTLEKHYENLLKLKDGWNVRKVEQDNEKNEITVTINYAVLDGPICPRCGRIAHVHDTRIKTDRHEDFCGYKVYLESHYPRVKCVVHGTQAIKPPYSDMQSPYTHMFKERIINLCYKMPKEQIAKNFGIDWHTIKRIRERGKKKVLEIQKNLFPEIVTRLGIDEKNFRGHDCVTILTDIVRGKVLAVLEDRSSARLVEWFSTQRVADFSELRSISMDMAPPYIKAVREVFPNADELICFDRFHVARLFNTAVDNVRRRESARFKKGENPLLRTRFEWLRNSSKTDNRTAKRRSFLKLTKEPLETAKTWKVKEKAALLWGYVRESYAFKAWEVLIKQMRQSKIKELKLLGKTIKNHLKGIINAIIQKTSNAMAESRNSCIQRLKIMACGFRSKRRFAEEIIFQYGGLKAFI